MKAGVVYPQTELGGDTGAVKAFAQAAEDLGYDHIVIYDHVLGAVHAGREPKLTGPYKESDPFHEPLVTYAYLAGVTKQAQGGKPKRLPPLFRASRLGDFRSSDPAALWQVVCCPELQTDERPPGWHGWRRNALRFSALGLPIRMPRNTTRPQEARSRAAAAPSDRRSPSQSSRPWRRARRSERRRRSRALP